MSVGGVEHADLGSKLRNQANLGTGPDQSSSGFFEELRREQAESGQKIGVPIDIVDHRFPALRLIGREERLGICTREDAGKFPSQVVGILDAAIHSLSAGGTIDV